MLMSVHLAKDTAMTSNSITLAAAIGLCALGACATREPETKQSMMKNATAMECAQMAGTPEHDKNDRRQEGRKSGRMMKAGCPMMAAKGGKPEQPSPDAERPKDNDPHADHRP